MSNKCIQIDGIHNRYEIKKVNKSDDYYDKKIRSCCKKWNIDEKYYHIDSQFKLLENIIHVNSEDNYNEQNDNNNLRKIMTSEINNKINGYKQQDIKKKVFDSDKFLNFKNIIDCMKEHNLKCYYCSDAMYVLYKYTREQKQWTVDRINNDIGHYRTNFNLVCLKCNLKRKRQSDEKYLFTSTLNIVKK